MCVCVLYYSPKKINSNLLGPKILRRFHYSRGSVQEWVPIRLCIREVGIRGDDYNDKVTMDEIILDWLWANAF